jgi:hypothetical protein
MFMSIEKGNIVKLKDGREVKIINLPTSFMANGSYEVKEKDKTFWIKPDEVLYKIELDWLDNLNNYFEIIYDENGINIIPKDLDSIDIESDREDIKRIKFNLFEGRKHKVINLHIGDTVINDKEKITIRPKKEKRGKFEKIINVLKEKEDEI